MKDLITFLIQAKKNTYANSKAQEVPALRPGSTDYHYEKVINGKNFVYHELTLVEIPLLVKRLFI